MRALIRVYFIKISNLNILKGNKQIELLKLPTDYVCFVLIIF